MRLHAAIVLAGVLALVALFSPPAGAQAPQLATVVLLPDRAGPKDEVQGLVTLTGPAPAGGAYVQLSASSAIWIPGTVVVPAGRNSSTFAVVVNRNAQDSEAVVVGSYLGQRAASNKLITLADPDLARQAQQTQPTFGLKETEGYPTNVFYPYPYYYPYYYPYPPIYNNHPAPPPPPRPVP